jgi:hypothetical protein
MYIICCKESEQGTTRREPKNKRKQKKKWNKRSDKEHMYQTQKAKGEGVKEKPNVNKMKKGLKAPTCR